MAVVVSTNNPEREDSQLLDEWQTQNGKLANRDKLGFVRRREAWQLSRLPDDRVRLALETAGPKLTDLLAEATRRPEPEAHPSGRPPN
jgi:hypothetical protein